MKIVADSVIPFLKGVFEPYADIVYKDGKDISADDLVDASALIVRTRTRCDASLLEGSPVEMIATATIGTDHIDLPWCRSKGIEVANAAGCNAGGVMNYVLSSLYAVASRRSIRLDKSVFGIIGVGNVGSKVEYAARKLGFEVLLCDPPRALKEGPEGFCCLDYLLDNADIVTIHTPLDKTTFGMAGEDFFHKIKHGAIFINAARGEIVNEPALIHAAPKLGAVIIDTWCNEPKVNPAVMELADIATPHIAGYSYQGKQKGTAMAVQAVARHFGIDQLYDFSPESENPELSPIKLDPSGKSQGEIAALMQYNYPVFTDDFMFRIEPEAFERLRGEYSYRREFYIE